MSHIYIPAQGPEDWKQFLAEPEKHWKPGFSAHSLAYCWQQHGGMPPQVSSVLQRVPQLQNLKTIFAFPEFKVPLPGGSTASQNDIWVIAEAKGGLVSIAVEGKVSELFGPTLGEWQKDMSPGKRERLQFLCDELGLACPPPPQTRYQLLHRAASAILQAKRFRTNLAVMVVHSFSQTDACFDDYRDFLLLFGLQAEVNRAASLALPNGISLSLAWVRDSPV